MPPKLKLASPELQAIVENVDNQICADCDARAPRWASVGVLGDDVIWKSFKLTQR